MQKKYSYIFSFKKIYKKYLLFFVGFYLVLFVSFLIFCIKPSLFYFRAWEYFNEIVFKVPSKRKWKAFEYGDFSRKYLIHFQNKRKTLVTCDEEGFRSTAIKCKEYPIVVFGDSHVWGSGLSDNETIPWVLSTQLDIPVFNAGRGPFVIFQQLKCPKILRTKIIVEIMAEHMLNEYFFEDTKISNYNKRIRNLNSHNIFFISPKRYFILTKLLKWVSPSIIWNEMESKNLNDYCLNKGASFSMSVSDKDLMKILNNIKEKARFLEELGYIYIFALTPNREIIVTCKKHGENIYDEDLLRANKMSDYFKKEKIHYVDMCSVFRKVSNPYELYQCNDTHIGSKGAKLIATALKEYILSLGKNNEKICLRNFFDNQDKSESKCE